MSDAKTRVTFLALTTDELPRWFGTGKGKSHAIMTTVTRPGGDHIGSLGLTYTTVHGWTGKTEELTEQFDNKCARCEKWLTEHTDAVTDTLKAYAEESTGSVRDMILSDPNAITIALDENADVTVTHPMGMMALTPAEKGAKLSADRKAARALVTAPDTDKTESDNVADIKARSASKVSEKPVKVEKCAVKGTDKVAAKPGTDTDGTHGTCPVCQTFAPLTGKGFIGTHTITGEIEPVSPTLSQKSVKIVDTGSQHGAPSDAAKKRDAEAYTVTKTGKGKNKVVTKTPNVPTTTAGQSPIGQRDHGMSDGPAMLPRGTYANGSTPDKTVTTIPMVGGRNGTLTSAEYAKLSRSAQRNYWRKVAKKNKR